MRDRTKNIDPQFNTALDDTKLACQSISVRYMVMCAEEAIAEHRAKIRDIALQMEACPAYSNGHRSLQVQLAHNQDAVKRLWPTVEPFQK